MSKTIKIDIKPQISGEFCVVTTNGNIEIEGCVGVDSYEVYSRRNGRYPDTYCKNGFEEVFTMPDITEWPIEDLKEWDPQLYVSDTRPRGDKDAYLEIIGQEDLDPWADTKGISYYEMDSAAYVGISMFDLTPWDCDFDERLVQEFPDTKRLYVWVVA